MSNSTDSKVQPLKLDQIRIDGGTQVRVEINDEAVAEYAEARKAGDILPPIVVFFDGSDNWLADGFHRYHSANRNGSNSIRAEVRPGTRRDAILFAVGSNKDHGLRRTNADKRHAIETLLADEEWVAKSDRWIAETAHVSNHLVADVRAQLGEFPVDNGDGATESGDSGTRTGQDGKNRSERNKRKKKAQSGEGSTDNGDATKISAMENFTKLKDAIGKAVRANDAIGGGTEHDDLHGHLSNAFDVAESWRTALSKSADFAGATAPLDGLKQPVSQNSLWPAFRDSQEISRIMRQVSSIHTFVNNLVGTEIGSRLNADDLRHFDTELERLGELLKFARPHAVCVYCNAADKKCTACKGQGWISKISYDQAPSEKKPK